MILPATALAIALLAEHHRTGPRTIYGKGETPAPIPSPNRLWEEGYRVDPYDQTKAQMIAQRWADESGR